MTHSFQVCAIAQSYEEAFAVIYVVEMVVFRIFPVFTIAILNAFIIARVSRLTRQKTKRRRQLQTNGSSSDGGGGLRGQDRGGDCMCLMTTAEQKCNEFHLILPL